MTLSRVTRTLKPAVIPVVIGAAAACASTPARTAAPAPVTATVTATAAPQAAGDKRVFGNATALLTGGIMVGNTLYLSGQLGSRASRDSGVAAETRSAIANARTILQSAGMDLSNVVSVTAYLAEITDYAAFNTAYQSMFTTSPRPTRTTLAVKALVNNARVELTMVAVR